MKKDIPQLGTKEFNDLASTYFGGKPKQETIKQSVVEWLAEQINGLDTAVSLNYFKQKVEQAKEMEEKQSQDYAAFCINCDRKNYPIVDFESYLKL
jgi:hypothetical protein